MYVEALGSDLVIRGPSKCQAAVRARDQNRENIIVCGRGGGGSIRSGGTSQNDIVKEEATVSLIVKYLNFIFVYNIFLCRSFC